jgi:hypothetical protein
MPSHQLTTTPARYAANNPEVPAYVAPVTNPTSSSVCHTNPHCTSFTPTLPSGLHLPPSPPIQNLAARSPYLRRRGPTIHLQPTKTPTKTPTLTPTGLSTSPAGTPVPPPPPISSITRTTTNATTSSIIAAPLRTVPSRLRSSPLALRTAKVVPRLVLQRLAPAAKACRGVAPMRGTRRNERAIGARMPVTATARQSGALARSAGRELVRPPAGIESEY